MTSGTILSSIGPPPPEFRRSFVPEHLRPKSLEQSAQQSALETSVRSEQKETRETAPPEANRDTEQGPSTPIAAVSLAGTSAVAVQVQEGAVRQDTAPRAPVAEKNEQQVEKLTDEEKVEVQRLKERDREVRAHETAHASAGSGFTGTPSFEFATGPDGVRYAVGGHVDIDVSEVPDNPQATIAKMEVIRAAALAPAQPSGQDRAVAAAAAAKTREAQVELAKQEREAVALEADSVVTQNSTSKPPQQISINLVV